MNPDTHRIDRRRFLLRMAALGLLSRSRLLRALEGEWEAPPRSEWIGKAPWPTLVAIMAHMLPSAGGAPGAEQIHAIDYLYEALENPAAIAAQRTRIFAGARRTEAVARDRFGLWFTALDEFQREQVLRQIENERGGQRWQSTLLTFLLEGLLSDPVYGGNFNEAGWRWFNHQPGFPRPPADKKWYRLAPPVKRRQWRWDVFAAGEEAPPECRRACRSKAT